jgi:hypothetical protein
MGLLRWRDWNDNAFEVVDVAWLGEYRSRTWRSQV